MTQDRTQTEALILSVGGTPEPLITSITHYHPRYVCFLASQKTFDTIVEVKSRLGEIFQSTRFEVDLIENENDLMECYQKAKECVARPFWLHIPKEKVIVDYTGGTKNMSVSLALAAIDQGYGFSYVGGNKRTREGVGTVESGHEKIFTHINPWDFMAVNERKRLIIHFNTYQFKAALEILDELSENARSMRRTYHRLRKLVEGYSQWDLFRHTEAENCIRGAGLDDLSESPDEGVRKIAQRTKEFYLPFLQNLITCSDRGRKPCRPMILDLCANAQRRFFEGKTDDAILRLYRVMEMLAQDRLLDSHGIETGNVPEEKIPESLRASYRERYKNPRTNRIEIPQNAAFELLRELDDPLGHAYCDAKKRIRDIQSARNTSYLAHGFSSSRQETYENFCEFVKKLGKIGDDELPKFPQLELS